MTLSKADLILHPIRGRIMMILSRRRLTTRQIAQALPDISQASVYRHVAILFEAGLLGVVEEIPARGLVERVYALDEEAAYVPSEEMAQATSDDYLRYFQGYMDDVTQMYRRYSAQENADPRRDGVAFWGEILYLTRPERDEMIAELREVTRKRQDNAPTSDRLRYYVGRIVVPESSSPESSLEEGSLKNSDADAQHKLRNAAPNANVNT